MAYVVEAQKVVIAQQHASYEMILSAGLILFVLLRVAGSRTHYVAFRIIGNGRHLAKMMGVAYALGILIQFINSKDSGKGQLHAELHRLF